MKRIKCSDEYLLWNAFLSVVDGLSTIPQSYSIKIRDWKDWNDTEDNIFIHMLKEYYQVDNSVWDSIGLPRHWKEEYLYLWIYITGLQVKEKSFLRSELQDTLELYND